MLSKATGLSFKEASSGENPVLVVGWKNLGKRGPDGLGGGTLNNETYTGNVTLNSKSDWVLQPGFKKTYRGIPGRGALILHELGHALGLGHVDDHTQIMHPVTTYRSPSTLSAGDKEGLSYLYAPAECG